MQKSKIAISEVSSIGKASETKQERWRRKNVDKWRQYHKEYMKKWRAAKKP